MFHILDWNLVVNIPAKVGSRIMRVRLAVAVNINPTSSTVRNESEGCSSESYHLASHNHRNFQPETLELKLKNWSSPWTLNIIIQERTHIIKTNSSPDIKSRDRYRQVHLYQWRGYYFYSKDKFEISRLLIYKFLSFLVTFYGKLSEFLISTSLRVFTKDCEYFYNSLYVAIDVYPTSFYFNSWLLQLFALPGLLCMCFILSCINLVSLSPKSVHISTHLMIGANLSPTLFGPWISR